MIKKLSYLFFLLGLTGFARAQEHHPASLFISKDLGQHWEQSDSGFPKDATVNAWVMHNGKLFAGTDNGILSSSDGLISWHSSNSGLPRTCRVISLISFKNVLIAGTYGDGIHVSSDDGASWQRSNTGLGNFTVRCFQKVGSLLLAGTNGGIYFSTNNGDNWNLQKGDIQINDFASNNGLVLAATNRGILSSGNKGNSWEWVFEDGAIFDLAIDEAEIFAMDYFGSVWRSQRHPIAWLKADLLLPFQYTFRLTPESRKFLAAEWNILNPRSIKQNDYDSGIPAESAIVNIIATPFGLLAIANPRMSE